MRTSVRFLFALTCFVVVLALAYQLWFFVQVLYWSRINPSQTSFMEIRLDQIREKKPKARLQQRWVPYAKISPHLKRALIAAEDGKFLDHEGFDFDAIQQAYEKNLKKGKIVAGGSTISQQLAKNLFLSPERSGIRKVQEAVITLMIELVMDKRRILEIYLNVIEWGDGVFGAEAAARHYYGSSAASLSVYQSARLAAMVPRPRFYDRNRGAPWLARKTEIIMGRMTAAHIP